MSILFNLTITRQGIYPMNLSCLYYPNHSCTNIPYFGISCTLVYNRIKLETIQVPA